MNENKRLILLKHLTEYHTKYDLSMKYVIINMINRLKNKENITSKQLRSVSKFLVREPYFEGRNTEQLLEFFETIIDDRPIKQRNNEDEYIPNTLEQFFS